MTEVAALVLAAGTASRFRAAAGAAGPATKLVACYRGRPLVAHVAEAALASRARPVIVVTGHARLAVEQALSDADMVFVHNAHFADGLSTSLKCGLAAVPPTSAGVVVLLGDMPRVSAALIDHLIDAFAKVPLARAVVPTLGGRRGNPVLVARALFDDVARLDGDVGAKPILQAAGAHILEVPVDDDAVTFDVDTPGGMAD